MINKELFYKVTLIDCNGKELEVAKFLQILTGMEKTETRRIVASLPCVLYEELDGEACSYIEEALDFYTAKYKFEAVGDENEVYEVDPSVYPSKQVIALGSMVDYIGKRSEFVSIARKYDFPKNVSLNDTPFLELPNSASVTAETKFSCACLRMMRIDFLRAEEIAFFASLSFNRLSSSFTRVASTSTRYKLRPV